MCGTQGKGPHKRYLVSIYNRTKCDVIPPIDKACTCVDLAHSPLPVFRGFEFDSSTDSSSTTSQIMHYSFLSRKIDRVTLPQEPPPLGTKLVAIVDSGEDEVDEKDARPAGGVASSNVPFFEDDDENADAATSSSDAVYECGPDEVLSTKSSITKLSNTQMAPPVSLECLSNICQSLTSAQNPLFTKSRQTSFLFSPTTSAACDVIRVNASALGNSMEEIGRGGDRGSRVYHVHLSDDTKTALALTLSDVAHKVYPSTISENEMAFIRVLFSEKFHGTMGTRLFSETPTAPRTSVCEKDLSFSDSGGRKGLKEVLKLECVYPAQHLTLPLAIVNHEGLDRGLLMPLYDCTLKQFLVDKTYRKAQGNSQTCSVAHNGSEVGGCYEGEGAFSGNGEGASFFLFEQLYDPVDSIEVIGAIAFQLLEAVLFLNHMAHTLNDACYQGFTHNDLHTSNILLSKHGEVAVCDFELVNHIPPRHYPMTGLKRLPPSSRQSPNGMFCETSDTWAFGLIILNLLTGVDPLFSATWFINDFGPGPLLAPYHSARHTPGVEVVDWNTNIRCHVVQLLRRDDPSEARLREAQKMLDICARCLVNCSDSQPPLAEDLIKLEVFEPYRAAPQKAEELVREWMNSCAR